MTETRTVALRELEHDPVAIAGNEQRLDKLDDLLASIPAKGLNQSLRVRPWAGGPPKTKGKGKKAAAEPAPSYGVIAGNRRLASLRRLRDAGAMILGVVVTDDWPVPVIIGDADDADAFEITSAENIQRLALTPVEEFRAFQKMADKASSKEIAAQFGVPEKRVQQRLKLAALHADVLDALDAGKISMEAAQAFTVEPDPKRQAAYLKKAKASWDLRPERIRAAFTDELIRGDSAIAKLIGKKAYVAAGGQVLPTVLATSSTGSTPKSSINCSSPEWLSKRRRGSKKAGCLPKASPNSARAIGMAKPRSIMPIPWIQSRPNCRRNVPRRSKRSTRASRKSSRSIHSSRKDTSGTTTRRRTPP